MELADMMASKAIALRGVRVRVPPRAWWLRHDRAGQHRRMSGFTETRERALVDDLIQLGHDALADEKLVRDLYGAIASRALFKRDSEGHVALSWKRAEEALDIARQAHGLAPLEGLAGSGGEGELTDRARDALEAIDWISQPENTDRHNPAHVSSPKEPPPASRPTHEPPEWERRAHDDAERNRLRRG
jgi:hypothetical protein